MSRRWPWTVGFWALVLLAWGARAAAAEDVGPLIARIKAVGSEGAGNAEASAAWRELAERGPDALPTILAGLDGAGDVAANWLRAAVDAIAERAVEAGRPLPADQLEAFVRQRRHAGTARRLAYEWLCRVDATAPRRLLPGMLDDPSPELRRDAVAVVLRRARKLLDQGDRTAAVAAYRRAFDATLDQDQADATAARLHELGVEVDPAAHFGFIRRWLLLGPFDSRGGAGFGRGYPPEKESRPARVYTGKDGVTLRWTSHTTDDRYGIVDLNKAIGKHHGAAAYALAVVESAVERPVQLRAASNNAIKIFLNGKLLFSREEYHHGMRMDQHVGQGTLRKGKNTILAKVCQNQQTDDWAQAWSFQLRVCDANGQAVPVTLHPERLAGRAAKGKVRR
jgi:hypothetical protein